MLRKIPLATPSLEKLPIYYNTFFVLVKGNLLFFDIFLKTVEKKVGICYNKPKTKGGMSA